MLLADTLSRAYLTEYERSATEVEVEHIHATHFLPVPEHQLKELQKETACDQTLQMLKKVIVDGFPDTKQELPADIHPFFHLHDELSVHDGIIFKGLRCVIPQTLRPRIKVKLHESHIGEHEKRCTGQAWMQKLPTSSRIVTPPWLTIHCDGHIFISFVFPQFTSFHSVFHSFHGWWTQ